MEKVINFLPVVIFYCVILLPIWYIVKGDYFKNRKEREKLKRFLNNRSK